MTRMDGWWWASTALEGTQLSFPYIHGRGFSLTVKYVPRVGDLLVEETPGQMVMQRGRGILLGSYVPIE